MIARPVVWAMRRARGAHARPNLSARVTSLSKSLRSIHILITWKILTGQNILMIFLLKRLFIFSHSGKKWTLFFHWFWRYIHILVCRYLFSWMWSRNVFILNIYRNITYIRCMYDAPIQFFFIFKNDRICYLSALFQSEFLMKDMIWK